MAGQTVVKQVTAEIRANTEQLDAALERTEGKLKKTKRDIEGTGGAISQTGGRYGAAAQQIASATEAIARNGKVGGEQVKQILAQGSQIAFAFGPKGAIIGALSIFGLAVATAMGRARKELEETAAKAEETLARLINAGDSEGLKAEARNLFLGTAADRDKNGRRAPFSRGIQGRRAEIARLEEEVAANPAFSGGRLREIARLRAELKPLEEEYKAVTDALINFTRPLESRTNPAITTMGQSAAGAAKDLEKLEREFERAAAEGARAIAAFDKEVVDFGRGFDAFILQELATNADRVAASFDELIAQGRRTAGASDPRVQRLIELRDVAVSAARAIDDSQATIRELDLALATGGQPTVETFQSLTADAARLRGELSRLQKGSKEYLAVQQQLLAVEQKRSALLDGVGSAGSGKPTETARATAEIAREIQQAVDGALQLAAAFGTVDASVVGVLRSITQIAGSLPALQTALASGGGLGIISAGLPILGALGSLIGNDPAEAARREELRRNTAALQALTEKAGFLGLGVAGGDALGAQAMLREFLSGVTPYGVLGRGGELYNAGNQATIAAESLGILADLEKIAAQYGITLNRNIESFQQLEAALADTITRLGEFDTDVESQLRQADLEIQLKGITDPLEKLALRLGALGGRSDAFDGLTAGLDLNTAEGRAAARENALALFELLKAGGASLDAAALGGLTGEQLLQAILDLVGSLDEADDALGTTSGTQTEALQVSSNTQITADQASRLLGLSATQATLQREIRDLLARALTASTTPLALPSAAVFAGGGSGATVHITIENTFNAPVSDAALLSEQQLAFVTEHIRRVLGRDVDIRQRYTGRVGVS